MRTLLMTLAMLGAAIGLSVLGLEYTIYRNQNSVDGPYEQRRLANIARAREKLDNRVTALSVDRCDGPVSTILALNTRVHIDSYIDIPPQLSADIVLCLKREIMSPYSMDRLTDSRLMQFFT